MSPNNAPDCVVHFGVFELDLRTGELRKSGVRVKLQEQPFRVLAMLLERPGEVVSRDELRNQLWAEETYVDFDHGLNTAVQRLRESLGDTAENPRFVQTLPRRGYRFLAPVNGDASGRIETSSIPSVSSGLDVSGWRMIAVASLVGGALLLTIVFAFDIGGAREWLRGRTAKTVQVQRITDFVGVKRVARDFTGRQDGGFCSTRQRPQADLDSIAGRRPAPATHPR